MKIAKRIIIGLILFVIVGWMMIDLSLKNYSSEQHWGSFTADIEEAIKNNSIIAIYMTKNGNVQKTIRVERILIPIPKKYVFYTPKWYSDKFFINDFATP